MLCRVVLIFEAVEEILKCNHSNESYRAAIYCVKVVECVNEIRKCHHSNERY